MYTVTDLINAIKQNDSAAVEKILTYDPPLVDARTEDGVSMVLLAQYYGRTDIVNILVAHNAQLDIYSASAIGNVTRVAGWLTMQPNLANTFSPDGYTPLGLAAFFGQTDVVNALLPYHVDPNIVSNNAMQVAPLSSAVAGNHYDIAAKLIEVGANVNVKQADGFTPLMSAAQNNSPQMVQLLLDHDADVNARVDKKAAQFGDMTALNFATQANANQVSILLQAHNAH